jgi:hypothetical protein
MFENDLKILKAMLLMYETLRIANREQLKEEIIHQINRINTTK